MVQRIGEQKVTVTLLLKTTAAPVPPQCILPKRKLQVFFGGRYVFICMTLSLDITDIFCINKDTLFSSFSSELKDTGCSSRVLKTENTNSIYISNIRK